MPRTLALHPSALLVAAIMAFACWVNVEISRPIGEGHDIYQAFLEGQRLLAGEDPYARILGSDMRTNDKYPTYFPVFYELSAVSQGLGLRSFAAWMAFWRVVFVLFELAIAGLLHALLARRGLPWIGAFASAFWLLNRWTLGVVQTANMDFVPIFFLLCSLDLLPRRRRASLLLFGLSLGFKQIAVFLAPLYLIWIAHETTDRPVLATVTAALTIASVPLVAALPFLAWGPEGFVRSILFSATRIAESPYIPRSLDAVLGWEGLAARGPLLVLLGCVYWAAFRGHGGRFLLCSMVMSVFLYFNTVLFPQYEAWVVPFLPLLFLELPSAGSEPLGGSASSRVVEPVRVRSSGPSGGTR